MLQLPPTEQELWSCQNLSSQCPGICFFDSKPCGWPSSSVIYRELQQSTYISPSCCCWLLSNATLCSQLFSVLTTSFSFVPCLREGGLWKRNQDEAQRQYIKKISARNSNYHSEGTCCCKHFNYSMKCSYFYTLAKRGWELINYFTPTEQTAWTVRNKPLNFKSHH